MKKLVSFLAALTLLLASVAVAENVVTPSITLPDITAPVISGVETLGKDGKPAEKPVTVAPVDPTSEEGQKFIEKAITELNKLATLKQQNSATYVFDFFAGTVVTNRAAAVAGITATETKETAVIISTTNEAGETVLEVVVVETPAVTLEEVAAAVFGAETQLVVHEFTTLAVDGFDADVHEAVTVELEFAADYQLDKVIVMIGSYDATNTLTWIINVCDVVNGKIQLTLDADTLKLVNEGKVLISVLGPAL